MDKAGKGIIMKKIAYALFILLNVAGLVLYGMKILSQSLLEILYIVEAAGLFLICCNSFYVPRSMDTIQMLDNKQQMKNDPLLIKPFLFLIVPIIVCFIILFLSN